MTAHVVTLAESYSWADALASDMTHLAGTQFVPPIVFFNATEAQRNIAPQYNSLTLYNSDSGQLEYYDFNRWVPFMLSETTPAYGDSVAYNTITGRWEPSPTTNPSVDSMRIYGSSSTALEVKRVYSDTGGSHASSTGSMDAVGVHTLTGSSNVTYTITIDSSGTQDWTSATFTWTDATTTVTTVPVYSGTAEGRKALAPIELSNGVFVLFTVGNYVNAETWTVTAYAADNQQALTVLTALSNGIQLRAGASDGNAISLTSYTSAAGGSALTLVSSAGVYGLRGDIAATYMVMDGPAWSDDPVRLYFNTGTAEADVFQFREVPIGLRNMATFTPNLPGAADGKLYMSSDTLKFANSTAAYEVGLLGSSAAPIGVDYLVGTASAGLTGEIVVGTTPGGELGGTWASPTVDTTHSGSSHAGVVSTHEAAADPHTGYVLESLLDAKGDLISASADNTPIKLTVGANDTILMADSSAASGLKWVASATPVAVGTTLATGTSDDFARASHVHVATTLVDSSGGTSRVVAASSSPHVSVTGDLDVSAHGAFGAAGTVGTAQALLVQENPTQAADYKGIYNAGTLTLASSGAGRNYYGFDNIMGVSGNFAYDGLTGIRTYYEHNVASTVTTFIGNRVLMYTGSLFGSTTAAVATEMYGSNITVVANPNTSTSSQTPVGTMWGQLINVIHAATANAGQTATVTTMRGLHVDADMAVSAQQRITTFTGIDIDLSGMTTGTIATGYALRIQDFGAATVTNRFGLYSNGTTLKHWLEGDVAIGSLVAGTRPTPTSVPLMVYRTSSGILQTWATTQTNDDNDLRLYQSRAATTDATVTTIQTIATSTGYMYTIEAVVNARNTGGATAGGYKRIGTFRNDGGVLTQVGATTSVHTAEDTAGWDVTMAVSGTSILVQVTGAAATNITWHAHIWLTTHNT